MARETLSRKAKTTAIQELKTVRKEPSTTKPKAKKETKQKVTKGVKKEVVPKKGKGKKGENKKAAADKGDVNEEGSTMADESYKNAASVYDFTVKDIKGEDVSLSKYKGNVLLIVNVASKCGYTSKHYKELVELDEQFRDKGLRILAFPCNQFGSQEPGSPDQICDFTAKRNVKFDIFAKINVNGDNADPLYKFLKFKQGGTLFDAIKWNFTKFIVDKNGNPVERHAANTSPLALIPNIEKYL